MSDVIGKEKYTELSKIVKSLDIESLSPEGQRKVLEGLLFDKAKKQLSSRIDKADFNTAEKVDFWLKDATASEYTRRSYEKAIMDFLNYLSGEFIHPLDVNYEIAVHFRNTLKDKYAYKSVKAKISFISSFYSFLERTEDISRNPFRALKPLKMQEKQSVKKVPPAEKVEQLIRFFLDDEIATGKGSHFKRAAAIPTTAAIIIMAYRGLRIGIFDTLVVKEGGNFTGFSKGKQISGNLDDGNPGTYDRLKSIGWKPKDGFPRSNTVKMNVTRKIADLYGKNTFSCHSFRHFFAVTDYKEHKDIYRLKVLLDHESISTTERYLQSLGIETK